MRSGSLCATAVTFSSTVIIFFTKLDDFSYWYVQPKQIQGAKAKKKKKKILDNEETVLTAVNALRREVLATKNVKVWTTVEFPSDVPNGTGKNHLLNDVREIELR